MILDDKRSGLYFVICVVNEIESKINEIVILIDNSLHLVIIFDTVC